MTPTAELRWREVYEGETGNSPTATSPYKHKVSVLQQKWATMNDWGAEIDEEWRDVPTVVGETK